MKKRELLEQNQKDLADLKKEVRGLRLLLVELLKRK